VFVQSDSEEEINDELSPHKNRLHSASNMK
jgi:hypothetical protein